ncbi:mobilization protein [Streptomyces sp. NPDC047046]|uniref:relaxase/mobilization nuclease domain-containing protein n=1 Tax=Streptomyces sp. NPDC047046 TaxID=3155378 RepID=UPI0033C16A56
MNPNITRGSRIYGLLAYLYGPGRHNEHTDPHLVGSWDGFAPDPGRDPNVTLKHLANTLALRPSQLGDALHKRHVWHCSVRTAPEDRELTDREWDMIARRVLHAVGVSREGDDDGCRWVAVRHARDHIHIAATLVRGDLRKVYPRYDYPKAQAACRELEAELGLRRLNPGDRTAAKRASTGERRKAERLNLPELPSDTLRTAVRQALAAAGTEEDFFAHLTAARILVRHKRGPSGDVLGYSVALPDDDTPIWYAGSTLAPDLSLPKIRRALPNTTAPLSVQAARASRPGAVRRRATSRLDRAQHALARGGDDGADDLAGTGAVLDALAATANEPTRSEILQAARAFERATRSHVRAENADRRALRAAAREIIRAGTPRQDDGAAAAAILTALLLTVAAAVRWHAARGHAQQAAAARSTAQHLRTAYRMAAASPMATLRDRAAHLPTDQRARLDAAITTALPGSGNSKRSTRPMDALTATLAEVQEAGYDPETLLRDASDARELRTAVSVEDVLVWRIRRLAHLPAPDGRNDHAARPADHPRTANDQANRTNPAR